MLTRREPGFLRGRWRQGCHRRSLPSSKRLLGPEDASPRAGGMLSACLRKGQIALRANGVSGGRLTLVARRRRGPNVAGGAGRRGIRVHARAPARTLCRRGGGVCAGERARPGGGVSGERVGGGGARAGGGGAVRCCHSKCSVGLVNGPAAPAGRLPPRPAGDGTSSPCFCPPWLCGRGLLYTQGE